LTLSPGRPVLDLAGGERQTRRMAHIYMTFDFGTDEEKAQLARHKLDGWKQAFRLDKKLLYKFERSAEPGGDARDQDEKPAKKEAAKPEKGTKSAKAGKKASSTEKAKVDGGEKTAATPPGPVKLHLRLAFSGHEKMTEERWLKRIPGEEPFSEAAPKVLKPSDAGFGEIEGKFESLE
jgi:hypothetical protein